VWFEKRGTHFAPGAEIPRSGQLQSEDLAPGGLGVPLASPQLPAPVGSLRCDPHEQEITCPGSQLTGQAGSQTT